MKNNLLVITNLKHHNTHRHTRTVQYISNSIYLSVTMIRRATRADSQPVSDENNPVFSLSPVAEKLAHV